MGVFSRLGRVVSLLSGLLLLAPLAGALTLSEVRTEARTLALDSGSTRQRFADARLTAWANEGQRQAVIEARPILKAGAFSLSAGSTYYTLPSDFLQMSRVTLDYALLPEKTPEMLDDETPGWQDDVSTSNPTNFYIDFSSRTLMGMHPVPTTTSGIVRYEYYAQASALSADGDTPFNSITELIPYHYLLAYFTAARMAAIDGKASLATFYMAEFKAGIERMKMEAKKRPAQRPLYGGMK